MKAGVLIFSSGDPTSLARDNTLYIFVVGLMGSDDGNQGDDLMYGPTATVAVSDPTDQTEIQSWGVSCE